MMRIHGVCICIWGVLVAGCSFPRELYSRLSVWGNQCGGNDVIPITCQGHRGGVCHIGGLFGEWRSIGIRCAPSLPLWYLARWVVLLNGLSPGPLRTGFLLGIACILRLQSSSCSLSLSFTYSYSTSSLLLYLYPYSKKKTS